MGLDFSIVLEGLQHAVSLQNLMWLVIGVTLGLVSGTLPGFSGGSMMAVLLPLIVTLPVDTMLIALAGIYAANVYSDSTAGILYNIPGGAAGIPATIEGYQLKQKGRLIEAFAAQVSASFFGATYGFVFLLVLVPTFIYFVQFFGAGERALLAVWALVFISSGVISKDDPLRSFLSVGLGLTLALVGQQPNIGTFRFTFGLMGLWDGLAVVLVVMGLFAVPQMLEMIRLRDNFKQESDQVSSIPFGILYRSMGRILWEGRRVVMRSSLFGVVVGIIPGIGTSTAAWGGYAVARSYTRQPEKFGTGNRDGILGAESSSNASEVGHIIPLLALGIPGSAAAAIMLAALNMVNINAGPGMYATHGVQVWTIMFGIGLSAFAFTILAYPFIRGAQWLSRLSVPLLVGGIGMLCVMGAYLQSHNLFGCFVMMVLGVITLFGSTIGLRPAAVLIGFVLGPSIEKELIRGYQIGGFERFLKTQSLIILLVIAGTLALALFQAYRERKARRAAEAQAATAASAPAPEDGALPMENPDDAVVPFSPALLIKDKILATLTFLLAIYLFVESLSYPLFASLWVYFVAGCFLLLPAGILWAKDIRRLPESLRWLREGNRLWVVDRVSLIEQAVVLVALCIYIGLIIPLGFVVASGVLVLILMLCFDRNIVRAVISGVGVALFAMGIKIAFQIYMPTGFFHL
jgi:putative tricarboxylic transport membrane protein